MTQRSNTSGGDASGTTSGRGFETVELSSTAAATPINTPISQQSGPTAQGGSMSTSSSGQAGTGAMQQAVDQAQDKAGEVADQAQQKVGEVVDQAKQTVTSQVSSRKDQAAESLRTVADAIRHTGDDLRSRDQAGVAQYASMAADRVEDFSQFISERDVNQIVSDVERYARRNKGLFLGGAFALGLVAARFLKSSSQPDYQGPPVPYNQNRYTGPRSYSSYQPSPYTTGSQGQYRSSGTGYSADRMGSGAMSTSDQFRVAGGTSGSSYDSDVVRGGTTGSTTMGSSSSYGSGSTGSTGGSFDAGTSSQQGPDGSGRSATSTGFTSGREEL